MSTSTPTLSRIDSTGEEHTAMTTGGYSPYIGNPKYYKHLWDSCESPPVVSRWADSDGHPNLYNSDNELEEPEEPVWCEHYCNKCSSQCAFEAFHGANHLFECEQGHHGNCCESYSSDEDAEDVGDTSSESDFMEAPTLHIHHPSSPSHPLGRQHYLSRFEEEDDWEDDEEEDIWLTMTNGTGGCAECSRRDCDLTASYDDQKLYCKSCWNNFAWSWEHYNQECRWIDGEHMTYTMDLADVRRANDPYLWESERIEKALEEALEEDDECDDEDRSEVIYSFPGQPPMSKEDYATFTQMNEEVRQLNVLIISYKEKIQKLGYQEIELRGDTYPQEVYKMTRRFEAIAPPNGDLRVVCENNHLVIPDLLGNDGETKIKTQLLRFYEIMVEEYDIASIIYAHDLLRLRLFNIQETIEQPTTFSEEKWSIHDCHDQTTIHLMREELEQLRHVLDSKLNHPLRITHYLNNFEKIPTVRQQETFFHRYGRIHDPSNKFDQHYTPPLHEQLTFTTENIHQTIQDRLSQAERKFFGLLFTHDPETTYYQRLASIHNYIRSLHHCVYQSQNPEHKLFLGTYDDFLLMFI